MKASIPLNDAQRTLVLNHHHFAKKLARQFYRQRVRGDLDYEDFEGAAMLGLCDAAGRFDPARNNNFALYASRRIHGAMIDMLRAIGSLPRMCFVRNPEEACSERQALPYASSAAELASIVNASSALNMRLFDSPQENETQIAYADHLTPEDVVIQSDCRDFLQRLISMLPEKEKSVVMQYYFAERVYRDMEETGRGCTKSWLSRLHHKGLIRLKKSIAKATPLPATFADILHT